MSLSTFNLTESWKCFNYKPDVNVECWVFLLSNWKLKCSVNNVNFTRVSYLKKNKSFQLVASYYFLRRKNKTFKYKIYFKGVYYSSFFTILRIFFSFEIVFKQTKFSSGFLADNILDAGNMSNNNMLVDFFQETRKKERKKEKTKKEE